VLLGAILLESGANPYRIALAIEDSTKRALCSTPLNVGEVAKICAARQEESVDTVLSHQSAGILHTPFKVFRDEWRNPGYHVFEIELRRWFST
jgi:hypothetical protein